MTDIDKIEGLQATIAELRQEKERLYINVANRDAEIERLNSRIRQDAERALQHLNEIDRLQEQVAALEEKI
jgi:peptidoglycan hydrolase CwlO-like protein